MRTMLEPPNSSRVARRDPCMTAGLINSSTVEPRGARSDSPARPLRRPIGPENGCYQTARALRLGVQGGAVYNRLDERRQRHAQGGVSAPRVGYARALGVLCPA